MSLDLETEPKHQDPDLVAVPASKPASGSGIARDRPKRRLCVRLPVRGLRARPVRRSGPSSPHSASPVPHPTPGMARFLDEAFDPGGHGLLVVNDLAACIGPDAPAEVTFGDVQVRFIAVARVTDGYGAVLGALIVADGAPHAGLSAAQLYVLATFGGAGVSGTGARRMAKDVRTARIGGPVVGRPNACGSSSLSSSTPTTAVLITDAEPIDLPGPRIVYCNAAFEKTTGYSEAEVLGKTPRILQSEKVNRGSLDRLKHALRAWAPGRGRAPEPAQGRERVLGGAQPSCRSPTRRAGSPTGCRSSAT